MSYVKVSQPINDKCFVRSHCGEMDGFNNREFVNWLLDNNISAEDATPECFLNPIVPTGKLMEVHANLDILWLWVAPQDAVLIRLRWAEWIK